MATKSEHGGKKSPLLVAASAGSLEAAKCLIQLGANVAYQDELGKTVVHVAAHRTHTNIISYFIEKEFANLPTWSILVSMLESEKPVDVESSVKCLQLLTGQKKSFWRPILAFGGIEKLCSLLRKFTVVLTAKQAAQTFNPLIYLNTLTVLCNLSDQLEIKQTLSRTKDMADILINILALSGNEDMESRVAILIGDIASVDEGNKILLAEKGCLPKLIKLLENDSEDVLVNAVNALEIMTKNNIKNQNFCCQNGVLNSLVALLTLNSGRQFN